jgi:hypothetical protein
MVSIGPINTLLGAHCNIGSQIVNMIGAFALFTLYICEGCFYNNTTWRAEGDHDMDFDIEKRGSRTQNSTEGLRFGPRASGTLLKNI